MDEKIRPIHFTAPDGEVLELHRPAFLVGNGINYADGCKFSWKELLISILPEDMQNNSQKDSDTNLLFKFDNASSSVQINLSISGKQQNGYKYEFSNLTYPEIAELALLKRSPQEYDKESKPYFMSKVVEKIKNHIENTSLSQKHENLARFAKEHWIPILTTNFDRNFLKTSCFDGKDLDSIDLYWNKIDTNIKSNDYRTLKNACFRPESLPEIKDIHSEFAIWHIHGVIGKKSYPLCLTNWDYFNFCAEIKKISKGKKYDDHKKDATWVDILLDNDLIIMGLELGSQETDLRAFLAERNIRHKVDKQIKSKSKEIWDKPKTIYIYRQEAAETEMPADKKAFFESLGIKCVPMAQDDIYEIEKYIK